MITIIDTGIANVGSFKHKLFNSGIESCIASTKEDMSQATKLILPGVGHFKSGMNSLNQSNMIGALNKKVIDEKIPILGICLGMQLMTSGSEEGNIPGLGWINSDTKKFDFSHYNKNKYKIPHVGWNTIDRKKESILLDGIPHEHKFYFTHSYYVVCNDEKNIYATTSYGTEFTCSFQKGNIFGTQFHPEKSHAKGFQVLINFIKYT